MVHSQEPNEVFGVICHYKKKLPYENVSSKQPITSTAL